MNLDVHINSVRGSPMAAKINGRFTIADHTFRFKAIAFGRIGGQNVNAKISRRTEKALADLGHDPEDVVMSLQRNLLQGNLSIPEGITRDSFADG